MNKKLLSVFLSGSIMTSGFCLPVMASEFELFEEVETTPSSIEMYRLYNRGSGEHFYTADSNEKDTLVNQGWKYEGIGWYAPSSSSTPVYRLYNQNSKDHHYTTDQNERDTLIRAGWKDEGIGWYSDESKTVPLYRQYNPNAKSGNHNYTTSKEENDRLGSMGWKTEGIGWYAMKEGEPVPADPEPTEIDYSVAYRPILDEAKRIVNNKGKGEYSEGLYGLVEAAWSGGSMSHYGYTIQDFSGDGIPELAIVDKEYGGNIYSLYTLVNNQPVNVFYGWARSRNYYAGGSTFIYNGSAGASYVTTGLFSLSKDGKNISYSEYYYTNPDSPSSPIKTYSSSGPNSTGKYIGGENVYSQKSKQIFAKKQSLNLTPLSQ